MRGTYADADALIEWARQSIAIAMQISGDLPIHMAPDLASHILVMAQRMAEDHEIVGPDGLRLLRMPDYQSAICCECIRILRPLLTVYPLVEEPPDSTMGSSGSQNFTT